MFYERARHGELFCVRLAERHAVLVVRTKTIIVGGIERKTNHAFNCAAHIFSTGHLNEKGEVFGRARQRAKNDDSNICIEYWRMVEQCCGNCIQR